MNTCVRPGCDDPAKDKYCSRSCANKDKPRVRLAAQSEQDLSERVQILNSGRGVPTAIERRIVDVMGGYDQAVDMLREMEYQATDTEFRMSAFPVPHHLATQMPLFPSYGFGATMPRPRVKPPESSEIEPYAHLVQEGDGYLSEVRSSHDMSYEDVRLIKRCAPCVLAARMKKAPLVAALSGERKWAVKSNNRKLAAVAKFNAHHVFLRHIQDMLEAMDYGSSFGSMMWKQMTADEIGVDEKGLAGSSRWYGVDKIQWSHPERVTKIIRDGDYGFAGFVHRRRHKQPNDVAIPAGQALVLTYNGRYGNLWGESMYEPVYPDWLCYEYVKRDFLRYLQRMAVPVAVCYAPQRGNVLRPDGTKVNAMEYGLLIAGYAAEHSGLVLPSDADPSTGEAMWRLEYLKTDQKGEQFQSALQHFTTMISRGIIVGDRAVTQEGDVGSYNAAEVHQSNTQIDNDMIFKGFLGQLDRYWMARYVEFNLAADKRTTLRLEAEVLDPIEREILMKLFSTAGNIKLGDGSPLDRINWDAALRGIHAPVLTDEEIEEQRKKKLQEQKEKQRALMQPKTNPFQQGGSQSRSEPKQEGPGKSEPRNANQEARLAIMDHLANGGLLPLNLSSDDLMTLMPNGGTIELGLDDIVRLTEDIQDGDTKLERTDPIGRTRRNRPKARADAVDTEEPSDPDFEKEHPRDEKGKFTKKSAEEIGDDEQLVENTDELERDLEEQLSKLESMLDLGVFPGRSARAGIETSFEFDGVNYTFASGISKDEVVASVRANALVQIRLGNGLKMEGLRKKDVVVINASDMDATSQMLSSKFGDEGSFLADYITQTTEEGRIPAFYHATDAHSAIITDVGFVRNGLDGAYQTVLAHETMHARKRSISSGEAYMWYEEADDNSRMEEAAATFMSSYYASQYGLPPVIGYPQETAYLLTWNNVAHQGKPVSMQEFYKYVDEVHLIDWTSLSGIFSYNPENPTQHVAGDRIEWGMGRMDLLNKAFPGWENGMDEIWRIYK